MIQAIHLRSKLKALTWPIFIELLLWLLLGFMDTVMLSRLSDNSVAAAGLANQILMLLYMIFMVGSTGTVVVCSQYVGAKQQENFVHTVAAGLLFAVFLGIVLSLVMIFNSEAVLQFLRIQPLLLPDAKVYLALVGGTSITFALCITINAVLRSKGLSRYPMYVSCIINVCNILGNYLLIFGKWGFPELGIEGAALSTTFSRFIALLLLLTLLFRYCVQRRELLQAFYHFPLDKLKHILQIGIPSGAEMCSYALSQMLLTYFINRLGTDALAARTYIAGVVSFVYMFALALAQGTSVCVGQLIGQHKNQATYLMGRYALRLGILVSGIMSILTAFTAPFFMPFLTKNSEIVTLCMLLFLIDIPLELGRAVNILGGRILAAVGNPNYPLMINLIVVWLVATGGGYFLGMFLEFGLLGMWVAFACDECLRGFLLLRRWESRRWQDRGFIK